MVRRGRPRHMDLPFYVVKMKHIQKLNDEIEGLKLNYSQLPEMVDKKIIYTEIENKREDINSILE